MQRLLSFLAAGALVLALPPLTQGQTTLERYSEVRLLAPADGHLQARLAAHGVGLDHISRKATARGPAVHAVLSVRDVDAARAAGAKVEILVEDLTAHYLATRRGTCEAGMGVSRIEADLCGPMGGYLTLEGVRDALDTLTARYPDVVSARDSIGASHEGRAIWAVEISDQLGVDEGEPEVLYTSLHHAREPGSMMAVLYFMYYLAEQYGADPDVTALVDDRRLFFVPVVNPDGYVYNEEIAPEGGGLWRKNRRDNGDGWIGVDLNRNYGYQWGHDDIGSSPFTFSETYRGPAPFSEPETRAVRDFELGREITAALHYHTPGRILLYPWGYTAEPTPDGETFESLADTLTDHNGYVSGQVPDVLYFANGDASDWGYGEQTAKPKALAFGVEAGYAFWPDPADVYAIADETLEANLLLAEFAEFPPPVANEPPGLATQGLTLEVLGPNPTRTLVGVAYTLSAPGLVQLVVYDVLGREVVRPVEGERGAGRHELRVDTRELTAGVYFLHLRTGAEVAVRQLAVVR